MISTTPSLPLAASLGGTRGTALLEHVLTEDERLLVSDVAEALTLADGEPVAIEGRVVRRTGDDDYIVADDTGRIAVIRPGSWPGTVGDPLRIEGRVARDMHGVRVLVDAAEVL